MLKNVCHVVVFSVFFALHDDDDNDEEMERFKSTFCMRTKVGLREEVEYIFASSSSRLYLHTHNTENNLQRTYKMIGYKIYKKTRQALALTRPEESELVLMACNSLRLEYFHDIRLFVALYQVSQRNIYASMPK